MATFLFAYRRPENYTPGRPAAIAARSAWFESMGVEVGEITVVDPSHRPTARETAE